MTQWTDSPEAQRIFRQGWNAAIGACIERLNKELGDPAALEVELLRIIASDYQALQHRANQIDDENGRLRAALHEVRLSHDWYTATKIACGALQWT